MNSALDQQAAHQAQQIVYLPELRLLEAETPGPRSRARTDPTGARLPGGASRHLRRPPPRAHPPRRSAQSPRQVVGHTLRPLPRSRPLRRRKAAARALVALDDRIDPGTRNRRCHASAGSHGHVTLPRSCPQFKAARRARTSGDRPRAQATGQDTENDVTDASSLDTLPWMARYLWYRRWSSPQPPTG